jgi:hypothetical protein
MLAAYGSLLLQAAAIGAGIGALAWLVQKFILKNNNNDPDNT